MKFPQFLYINDINGLINVAQGIGQGVGVVSFSISGMVLCVSKASFFLLLLWISFFGPSFYPQHCLFPWCRYCWWVFLAVTGASCVRLSGSSRGVGSCPYAVDVAVLLEVPGRMRSRGSWSFLGWSCRRRLCAAAWPTSWRNDRELRKRKKQLVRPECVAKRGRLKQLVVFRVEMPAAAACNLANELQERSGDPEENEAAFGPEGVAKRGGFEHLVVFRVEMSAAAACCSLATELQGTINRFGGAKKAFSIMHSLVLFKKAANDWRLVLLILYVYLA